MIINTWSLWSCQSKASIYEEEKNLIGIFVAFDAKIYKKDVISNQKK